MGMINACPNILIEDLFTSEREVEFIFLTELSENHESQPPCILRNG